MEFVETVIQLAPVPYLDFCFTIFKAMWDAVKEVQSSRVQFAVLGQSVAQLLQILDKGFRTGSLRMEDLASEALVDLERLLKDIVSYIQCSFGFIKLLLIKDETLAAIDTFHRRISNSINVFQVAALIDMRIWQTRSEEARRTDQGSLHTRLRHLEANQRLLIGALEVPQNSPKAMMATLRRRVDEKKGDDEELRFLKHSLRYLSTTSGQQVDLQSWTITAYDVEFGPLIGVGGFGKVYRGKWNHADVALKVMKNAGEITPRATAVRREVKTWSKLRHPNILQFLGANILDDDPFLVMPLIEGGNARDYIDNNPHCNRLKIIQQISLGLTYLHSQSIVHGDLKAVNVLIDDAEKALLCDFGLARLKSDVNSRTSDSIPLQGSQNWMAPELFEGRSLRKPCDIYSFAMTVYEIYTGEIPFGKISPNLIPKLVAKRGARPERPEYGEALCYSDEIWSVTEHCWLQNAAERPLASVLSETLSRLLETARDRQELPPLSANISDPERIDNVDFTATSSSYSTLMSPLTTLYMVPDSPLRVNHILPDTPPRSLHRLHEMTAPSYDTIGSGPAPAFPIPDASYDTMFRFPSFALSLPSTIPIKTITDKRLVVAFDIGVTYSGISYSVLEEGKMSEVKGVTIFSEHDHLNGSSKVPTNVYYDEFGELRAIGAETLSEEVIKVAETNGWKKVKWFKLHLLPQILPGQRAAAGHRYLPPNKRPEDILSDYLRYLYRCTITYIKKTHVNGQDLSDLLSSQGGTHFILSYPNGWEGVQEKMRYAATRAGMIPDSTAGRERLSFVTEGEANLAFVVGHGTGDLFHQYDGVAVIVDAGDYMVTISSYVKKLGTTGVLSFEEITQPQLHLCGSIFVTSQARAFLQRTLSGSKFKNRIDTVLQSFERTTKFRFNNPEHSEYLTIGSTKDNDKKRNIRNGQMRLSGTDVMSFFTPSITCIVDSVKEQRKISRERVTHVILVGELSASEWIFSSISAAFKPLGYSVIRPDYYVVQTSSATDRLRMARYSTILKA